MRATQLTEKVALMKKAVMQSKQETMHLFGKVPGEDSLVSRIKNWADKIKKLEVMSTMFFFRLSCHLPRRIIEIVLLKCSVMFELFIFS